MTTSSPPVTPPDERPPSPQEDYRRVFLILVGIGIVLMLLLPPPSSTVILVGLIAGSLAMVAADRDLMARLWSGSIPIPVIRVRARVLYALEIGTILVVLLGATWTFQNFSPEYRVRGPEFSYLINSGTIAADIFHRTGAIPLWNPFLKHGEPLLESPFSFVLNPLMTLPIFAIDPLQGTKIAVILHVLLMGVGGWLVGYVLRLHPPGRLLLGLLMGGSGSMAGAIGYGFYQMSLSQAYMPWIIAGTIGVLRYKDRLYIGILAVATALLIFAGTFWYVLPMLIAVLLLVLFGVVKRGEKRLTLDIGAIKRLMVAGAFIVGLSAVRLIPQAVNHDYIRHPREALDRGMYNFETVAQTYFVPYVPPPFENIAMYYHYILSPVVALFLLAAKVLIVRREREWRVVIPGFILIIIFTSWAQEGTPVLQWLYRTFPILSEWRFVGRMMAAAVPWFAIIAALWLDDLIAVLHETIRRRASIMPHHWNIPVNGKTLPAAVLLIVALVTGGFAGWDATRNWGRMTGLEAQITYERYLVYFLRNSRPTEFLPVMTSSFFVYLPFYETLTRASFGNPDYSPDPIPATIGHPSAMEFPQRYGVGGEKRFTDLLLSQGFEPLPEGTEEFGDNLIWHNPNVPNYVFAVHLNDVAKRLTPLTRSEAMPINTYTHNIDHIQVRLGDYAPGFVVVVQEVAFPGWRVTIDGQPAPLESVGGFIGVQLPDKPFGSPDTLIEFAYEPPLLHAMGYVTIASVVVFTLYLLRVDRRYNRRNTVLS